MMIVNERTFIVTSVQNDKEGFHVNARLLVG